jgi:fatty-acid desaturase
VTLAAMLWPRARADYSGRVGVGRMVFAVLLVMGAIPLAIEIAYHRYWPHIAIFSLVWIAMSAIGRLARYALARE